MQCIFILGYISLFCSCTNQIVLKLESNVSSVQYRHYNCIRINTVRESDGNKRRVKNVKNNRCSQTKIRRGHSTGYTGLEDCYILAQ